MKKTLCIIVAAVVALCAMGISAAAEASAEVYVTIANGGLEIANSEVTVKDLDGDGKLTIDEALFAAHEAYYKGGAAAGYASYGNQIGLATGQVDEIYHPGYVAKRMEIGAVVAAAPERNVVREAPVPGDLVILLGGRTGRDGCGGAVSRF